MPYARGDYVGSLRGNYSRGDPFIGGLIGGAAKALGVGKLVSKAAGWVGKQITGSSVKKAVIGTGVTIAGAGAMPILTQSLPTYNAPPPIQIGPLGINPMNALPGGEPLFTYGRRKYRRMNVLNPRALKRALRRAEGFEKFARKTVNALRSGPKKFKSASRKRG